MPITKEELAHRLKLARENAGLTQDNVAEELGVSRGLIGQIEAGVKAPNSLQLASLAELYSRDVGEFLRAEFDARERDALAVLFRADVQLAEDADRALAVRECTMLCREYANLEALLGLDMDRVYPVAYDAPAPRNRWEAIRQGERLAELERARLKLGDGPIQDLAAVLEPQGVRLLDVPLSESVSGIFLADSRYGLSIIVNAAHHPRRKVFSYAHEYCHVLVDRDRTAMVSKAENREELSEVRANAFAAAFLMPEAGVRAFIRALGKGEPTRSVLQAFDEVAALEAQKRLEARSQDLSFYDVAHLAHHFGVSYDTALYRVLNLKLISEEERGRLAEQRELANAMRVYLGPEPHNAIPERLGFKHQLLGLALEAYRRDVISRGKLKELCALAQVPTSKVDDLIEAVEQASDAN